MGLALWAFSGLAAFLIARIVPPLRPAQWPRELLAAAVSAVAAGVAATALDFGGWDALEWRGALFAFLAALTTVGVLRLIRSYGSARHPV